MDLVARNHFAHDSQTIFHSSLKTWGVEDAQWLPSSAHDAQKSGQNF